MEQTNETSQHPAKQEGYINSLTFNRRQTTYQHLTASLNSCLYSRPPSIVDVWIHMKKAFSQTPSFFPIVTTETFYYF